MLIAAGGSGKEIGLGVVDVLLVAVMKVSRWSMGKCNDAVHDGVVAMRRWLNE